MTHITTIIDRKRVNDSHVAILVRCCNDPATDQWHTYIVESSVDAPTLQAWADLKKSECSAQHDSMLSAISALNSLT